MMEIASAISVPIVFNTLQVQVTVTYTNNDQSNLVKTKSLIESEIIFVSRKQLHVSDGGSTPTLSLPLGVRDLI